MESIRNIKQEPFASTLMSSIKAAKDYYHNDSMSKAMIYGLSGHAFTINITRGLGPCAPYTFDMKGLDELVQQNLGLSIFESPSVITEETQEVVKQNAANRIKYLLDQNHLVLLSSFEFQLITNYDQNYLYTTKPWTSVEGITPNLEMDSFKGMIEFFTYTKISKTETISKKEGILNSLKYAVSTYENPSSTPDSAMGYKAYDFWLDKITEENAISHGNWWTSNVWAESRAMASLYMGEIKEYFQNDFILNTLSVKYALSSNLLKKIADKESNMKKKILLIQQLRDNELEINNLLKELLRGAL